MRTFLVIKKDNKDKEYIAEVINSNIYPSTVAKNNVRIIEIPTTGKCHIEI